MRKETHSIKKLVEQICSILFRLHATCKEDYSLEGTCLVAAGVCDPKGKNDGRNMYVSSSTSLAHFTLKKHA